MGTNEAQNNAILVIKYPIQFICYFLWLQNIMHEY
jgi:hypothetical protein